jgi:hypothetical protein
MPKKSKKNIKKTTRKRGSYNLKKTFRAGNRIKGNRIKGNRIKGNNSSKKLRKNKQNTNGGSQEDLSLSWEDLFEPTITEIQERRLRIRKNNTKLKEAEKEINKKYPYASREEKMEILRDMMGYEDKEKYKNKVNYVGSDVIFVPPPSKQKEETKKPTIWRFPQRISPEPIKQNNYYDKPPEIIYNPNQYIISQDLSNKSDDSQELDMNILFEDEYEDEDSDNKSPPRVQRKKITRSTRKSKTKSNEKKSNEIKPGGPKKESILESLIRERETEPVKTNIIFPRIKTKKKGFTINSKKIEGSLFKAKSNKPKSKKSKSN